MKKNYNRDQFKRIFSFFAAVLLVGLYAAGFAWVWYESYSDAILLPFYRRGNWVMILIYVVLVLLFAKSFGGLKIGYLKRTDMFYSQTLSIFCVNVVTYFQISVVNRDFSAAVPMILLTIADLAVLLYPFLPFSSAKICGWLQLSPDWKKQQVEPGTGMPRSWC